MQAGTLQPPFAEWSSGSGLEQLQLLFRAIVYQPSEPILIADNDRRYRDASCGAGKLFGLARDKIVGRRIDDFAEPGSKPEIEQIWQAFLRRGEQQGAFRLVDAGGRVREVEFAAKRNVLPACHVVALRDKSQKSSGDDLAWAQDYAVFLFDPDGHVGAWYSGAERIYGYLAEEMMGRSVACLYPKEVGHGANLQEELKRTSAHGHSGNEGWHVRKDGSRFWANVLTMALRGERGELQGYARVVRDFSNRRAGADRQQRGGVSLSERAEQSTVAGVVSGEFDHITEANDAFLDIVGYSREDLDGGRLYWPDLTPAEYSHLDEEAHEEGLRYGACTPFEKEYVRKDGTRVNVLVAVAVLNLAPFRWIAIVQALTGEEAAENGASAAERDNFEEIVGGSAALELVLGQIHTVAPTDATVLILGETGTGKELVARAIHRMSHRKDFPFVTLNCAAIPTGLLESELFGYEKGAFTGALSQKIGRFELANRGTLFLDEVGDIPLDLQPKLLRALQERAFERLGGTRTIPINVRLIAATNRNLTEMMRDKLFRSDLYYRLKVFPITTPPLREHPEDIPMLVRHFTQKYAQELHKQIDKIPTETMRSLVNWPWPGNVRELENFIERSVILSPGFTLRVPLVELRNDRVQAASGTLAEMERGYIIRVLCETNGVVSAAAIRLGLPRTTLNAMMQKLRISREDFA